MRKLILIAAVAALFGVLPGSEVSGQECGCPAATPTESYTLLICPQGDGPTLAEAGAIITLQYSELAASAHAWSPGGCGDGITWCGARPESDSATGPNNQTTVSGSFAGGGYAAEFVWIIHGFYLPVCYMQFAPVTLVSPDLNADLEVNLVDFSTFGQAFPTFIEPNKPYDPRIDFDGDGTIGLVDFALFSLHMHHGCS